MSNPLITNTVDVFRLTRTGNTDAYGASPVATGVDVSITPAGTDIVAVYGGNPAVALYEVYCFENVTLKSGDKLKEGSKEWVIRGDPQVIENRFLSYRRAVAEVAV